MSESVSMSESGSTKPEGPQRSWTEGRGQSEQLISTPKAEEVQKNTVSNEAVTLKKEETKLTKEKNPKQVAQGKVLGAMSRAYKNRKNADILRREMAASDEIKKAECEAEKALLLSEENKSYNKLMLAFTVIGVVVSVFGLCISKRSLNPFKRREEKSPKNIEKDEESKGRERRSTEPEESERSRAEKKLTKTNYFGIN
jgi:hypothetical protein